MSNFHLHFISKSFRCIFIERNWSIVYITRILIPQNALSLSLKILTSNFSALFLYINKSSLFTQQKADRRWAKIIYLNYLRSSFLCYSYVVWSFDLGFIVLFFMCSESVDIWLNFDKLIVIDCEIEQKLTCSDLYGHVYSSRESVWLIKLRSGEKHLLRLLIFGVAFFFWRIYGNKFLLGFSVRLMFVYVFALLWITSNINCLMLIVIIRFLTREVKFCLMILDVKWVSVFLISFFLVTDEHLLQPPWVKSLYVYITPLYHNRLIAPFRFTDI